MRQQGHKRSRTASTKTIAIISALVLGGGGAAVIAANANAGPDEQAGQQAKPVWTINCPDVSEAMGNVPGGAKTAVGKGVADLDMQVMDAYGAYASKRSSAQDVLAKLGQQRGQTIRGIKDALAKEGAAAPGGLASMSSCKMMQDKDAQSAQAKAAGDDQNGGQAQAQGGPDAQDFVDIKSVQPNTPQEDQKSGSTGSFTTKCGTNKEGHFNSDNVIAAPGVQNGAHHVHDYVGNDSTSGASTDDSLAAAGTTCDNGDLSTHYWPVLRSLDGKDDQPQNDNGASQGGNDQAGGDQANGMGDMQAQSSGGDQATEQPGADQGQGDQQGTDQGQGDQQGTDQGQGDQQGTDQGQGDQQGTDQGQGDQQGTDQGQGDQQGTDQGQGDQQGTDQGQGDQQGTDQGQGDQQGTDQGQGDQQGGDQQAGDGGAGDGNVGTVLKPVSAELTFTGNKAGDVTAMPRFLRIITGDAKAFTNGTKNANASWSCSGFEDRQLKDKYPLCPEGSKTIRSLKFENCWDGQNTDSGNHRDHIAFADDSGKCPDGFKAIPQLEQKISYDVPRDKALNAATPFAVDSFPEQLHKPVTDHGDFINVMPDKLMSEAVSCINEGRDCG